MTAVTDWGDVIVTSVDNRPRIDRADKFVKVSDQFIEEAKSGKSPWLLLVGDVLTLRGNNREVQYRLIGPFPYEPWTYSAERIDD
jgi:hypothetical protein